MYVNKCDIKVIYSAGVSINWLEEKLSCIPPTCRSVSNF